ncbi:MAG: exosortase K [Butyrivibrio sp.]|nr:exosortase K [Acetatifactor muris]MCM1558821.1 exosortase K [Butyrivibrio sp.]
MSVKKEINLLRQNFLFYLAGALLLLGLKCYYRQADCDSLLWILKPTAGWVQFLSGIPFIYLPGTGYVNHDLRLLIAPSCSGVRFMTVLFATLFFSFVHIIAVPGSSSASGAAPDDEDPRGIHRPVRAGHGRFYTWLPGSLPAGIRGICWIAVSGSLAWLFTVFVNGLRIIAAIYLPIYLEEAGLTGGILTHDRLHTLIGVVVYFIALLTIYRLADCFVRRGSKTAVSPAFWRKCAPPVFWYFVLTLGLPLLHSFGRKEFTEFAVLVTGCCGLILLPYATILFLRRRKQA